MSDLIAEVSRIGEQSRNTERRIDAHEDVCAKRYGDIADSFVRVHVRLDGILKGIIALLVSIVLGLAGGGITLLIQHLTN